MGGGGGGGETPPPPIPSSPTRWLYDRNGDPTTVQEYAHYVRKGRDQFTLIMDNNPIPQGQYLSPERASEKNPKVWLYDDKGHTVKQIFKGGEGPDDTYDESLYNLGPDQMPYRHWYDVYGVAQEYAPSSTEIPEGYWESASKAPKSPNYKAPTPFNEVDPALNVQPNGNTGNQDLAATKAQSKKRRSTSQSRQLTLLGENSNMSDSEDSKNLLGE